MPLRIYRRRLPHGRQDGAAYFVTWRLHRGQRPLSPDERSAVFDTLRRFDGARFQLDAMVVMDDHVHVVVTPGCGRELERLVQAWKAFSARRLLVFGRRAPIWQREYHDRIIRSASDHAEKIDYVRSNPRRRWPSISEYPWVWITGDTG
jgi:REP element-mobilizing transposase RayT